MANKVLPPPLNKVSFRNSQHRLFYPRFRLTRNSAIADKPARRVCRSVKVTKHSTIRPFHMLDKLPILQ